MSRAAAESDVEAAEGSVGAAAGVLGRLERWSYWDQGRGDKFEEFVKMKMKEIVVGTSSQCRLERVVEPARLESKKIKDKQALLQERES